MSETAAPPRPAAAAERGPGYEEDFVRWSAHQAALLRAGRLDLEEVYPTSRRLASAETGLALRLFPRACPYPVQQVLDPEFVPRAIELDP